VLVQARRSKRDKRDRSRSRSRSRSQERKRRRDASPAAAAPPPPVDELAAARQQALAGHDAEESRKQEREREQAALEDEMEKRRKRIEAWQEQRRKLAEQEAATATATAAAAEQEEEEEGMEQKRWNLEDEGDLSEGEGEGGSGGHGGGAENGAADAEMPDAPAAAPPPPVAPLPPLAAADEEDEEDPLDAFMRQNEAGIAPPPRAPPAAAPAAPAAAAEEGEEVDPLDAFMAASVLPEVARLKQPAPAAPAAPRPGSAAGARAPPAKRRRRPAGYDSDSSVEGGGGSDGGGGGGGAASEEDDDAEWARKLQAGKLSKGDKLGVVDHSTVAYPPFRRNFYIEVPELARMSPAEVDAARRRLDGLKVRGKDVPKPVRTWTQCGLSSRVLEVLRKAGFEGPLPIQAQALPVIMSGRDCMGVAKTGSGKTLAFVLPMIRHVKDQPPLEQGDGPVALIMAPTRELVTQIGREVRPFARAAGLACTAVYGGSGVANQISELKRGAEVVVCTPGRMIDILATGAGRITNLRRVTYLVLDEADRMFDMGFEPQIMRMVNNVRPDRQTVLFSATFPRSVEAAARQILRNPVEIQLGGRSVVNRDITQFVELRAEGDRFLRLLEVLGEWYERGKLLIFVASQDRCDQLFRDLLRAGYPCLSLHGGKDQSDRESTIADFKSNVCNVLVATSVAARGLDVRDLVLVLNYDPPNHHEDYVHRVGRTGRAGAKGTAVTFIAPEEEQYAPDLVKALKESGAAVPSDLAALAEGFERKRKAGTARGHGSGFGGTGFKFDGAEEDQVRAAKKAAAKEFGGGEEGGGGGGGGGSGGESEGEREGEEVREVGGRVRVSEPTPAPGAAAAAAADTAVDISVSSPCVAASGTLNWCVPCR
jgi:ATP-dependent RNA helicase DDX46/PRP5